jgi:hypothetical protein
MSRNLALGLFLATCVVLAALLLSGTITSLVGATVFAVALLVFGGLSRAFRGNGKT